MRRTRLVMIFGFGTLAGLPSLVEAEACGYPWTVTAAYAGGRRVAARLCGTASSCLLPNLPNRRIRVEGGQIRVTYTKLCGCLGLTIPFSDTMVVDGVAPGTYTINAVVSDCGEETIVGSTTFTLNQVELIPTFDPRGIAALALLLIIAALWRLRS